MDEKRLDTEGESTHDARLLCILAETLRLEPAEIVDTLEMQFAGSWDSLTHMELIVAVEDAFEIQLDEDEIVAMTSIGAIKRILRGKTVDGAWS